MGRLARAYCRVFGHTRDRAQPDAQCVRVRTCERCGDLATEQEHAWGQFVYVATGRCEQERRCRRCGATDSRVLHAWGPWRYVGPDNLSLKLHQVHTCGRCGAEEETEFERSF